jgi:hypothetical protein
MSGEVGQEGAEAPAEQAEQPTKSEDAAQEDDHEAASTEDEAINQPQAVDPPAASPAEAWQQGDYLEDDEDEQLSAGDGRVRWEGNNPRNVHVAEDGQVRAATDLPGGDVAARSKFTELTGRQPSGSIETARLPDGTYVTYRSTSGSGTPAISINAPTVKYETIHFRS